MLKNYQNLVKVDMASAFLVIERQKELSIITYLTGNLSDEYQEVSVVRLAEVLGIELKFLLTPLGTLQEKGWLILTKDDSEPFGEENMSRYKVRLTNTGKMVKLPSYLLD